ncbi:hypothetical protein XA68_11442 [Ophiocordyceps unilateralis]|uniref:Uncharacterized protein n=1 Tax=Ophiocordyceps unilateralis TaxID=268505 RepID=A0A2A9PQK2_OPHUN|nr:hypothetical protein XA68_11442 [Ophiocordyceps unilateralis]
MAMEIHLLKFVNRKDEVIEWGIGIQSTQLERVREICISAVALDEADGTNLCLYCIKRPEALEELYCRQTTLGQVWGRSYEWMMKYIKSVEFLPEVEPCPLYKTSRMWMWNFVEGLHELKILGQSALRLCEMNKRDECVEQCKLVATVTDDDDETVEDEAYDDDENAENEA